ncbi:MAG TPA: PQQ-binding-like beta-propeller repeat protein [Hyphomonadaceae bacterium]|jgi:polyvinyl alcohol dehydrogenase (cytochrome)
MRSGALLVIASALLTASCIQTSAPAPQVAATHVVTPEEDAAHPGKAVYDKACGACHNNPEGARAPGLASLRLMRKPSVEYAITIGYMRTQAKNLTANERMQVVDWLALGQPDNSAWIQQAKCKGAPARINASATSTAPTWGVNLSNTRMQTSKQSGLRKQDFANLELAWAAAFPQTPTMRSQPVVVGSTIYVVASDAGRMYALDANTGCAKWQYESPTPLRSSISYGEISKGKPVIVAGDATGFVVAVDALNGKQVWRSDVRLHEANRITGTPVIHKGRVYAPLSATEINHAVDEAYECCKAQGAVIAIDLGTGRKIWTGRLMEEAKQTQKSRVGTQMWGPSGGPIWNTPAIDEKRNLLYVGTGEQNSIPFVDTTDAIVAFDLDTGQRKWVFQATERDLWHYACPRGANCFGAEQGVTRDVDFGGSVVIGKRADGRDIILAGQKSGDIWALDPDNGGKLIWNIRLSRGGANGGVHWGIATDGSRVFAPMNDNSQPTEELPLAGVALHALDVETGKVMWTARGEGDCSGDRKERYAGCDRRFGFSPAPLIIDGAVLQGSVDGILRVFDAKTGAELWRYDTMRKFDTVNGVPGNGGSIDSSPYIAANGMLYVVSGYARFGESPGNVLLAFKPKK